MPAGVRLILGDCLDTLPTIESESIDVVLCDPPYPEISRPYGRLTEAEWWALVVEGVVPQVRRVLKPTGSAVFVLQPNSRKVGSMRGWLFEFQAWCCREWNMVQDAWAWRIDALPTAGAPDKGMMRQSLKACVWLGPPDCYRDQGAVLWTESDENKAQRLAGRCDRQQRPSGWRGNSRPRDVNKKSLCGAAARGGVTPFNVIPVTNADSTNSAGAHGHGAGTPATLCNWWLRYICPEGGTVLDPFVGSGTVALEALKLGRSAIGIEKMPAYHATCERRVADAFAAQPLFAPCSP